jgi:hypothetical protein
MENITAATGRTDTGAALDRGATALILGVAALMWFGWSQASPPPGWSLPLGILAVAGIGGGLVCLCCGLSCMRQMTKADLMTRAI